MKKEIKLSEAVGKIFNGFEVSFDDSQVVLIFSEDTFSTIGLRRGYYRGEDSIHESKLNVSNFSHARLIELGIYSQKEIDDLVKAERKKRDDQRSKFEKREYERLKRKFEI